MVELTKEEIVKIKDWYKDATDTCVFSVLQGYMGRAFADNNSNPAVSFLLLGDFLFPSGDIERMDHTVMVQMLNDIKAYHDPNMLLIIPQNSEWHEFLTTAQKICKLKRYSLSRPELSEFDHSTLLQYADKLPSNYEFARMDEAIARKALSEKWSKDFCANFNSPKDYEQRGLGIAILCNDEIVCAASSYSCYDKGIEIEIATKQEYRRQGLATMCGARLILECIKEKRLPNWDAANLMSVEIAKKLGYQYLGSYDAFYFELA